MEVLYELLYYGIPIDALPVDTDGNHSLKNHKLWIEERRRLERAAEAQSTTDTLGMSPAISFENGASVTNQETLKLESKKKASAAAHGVTALPSVQNESKKPTAKSSSLSSGRQHNESSSSSSMVAGGKVSIDSSPPPAIETRNVALYNPSPTPDDTKAPTTAATSPSSSSSSLVQDEPLDSAALTVEMEIEVDEADKHSASAASSSKKIPFDTPLPNDVIIVDKGKTVDQNEGNIRFRDLIAEYCPKIIVEHNAASKLQKKHVIHKLRKILQEKHGVRFIKRVGNKKRGTKPMFVLADVDDAGSTDAHDVKEKISRTLRRTHQFNLKKGGDGMT